MCRLQLALRRRVMERHPMIAPSVPIAAMVAAGCDRSDRVGAADGQNGGAARGAPRLFAGGKRTCVVEGDQIRCWGDASHGSLGPKVDMSAAAVPTSLPGIESAVGEPTPARIAGIRGASQIASGDGASCAVVGGSVLCWGSMRGPKETAARLAKPTRVAGLGGPVGSIAIAGSSLLAVHEAGWAMRTPTEEDQKPAHIPVPQPVQVSCATGDSETPRPVAL